MDTLMRFILEFHDRFKDFCSSLVPQPRLAGQILYYEEILIILQKFGNLCKFILSIVSDEIQVELDSQNLTLQKYVKVVDLATKFAVNEFEVC